MNDESLIKIDQLSNILLKKNIIDRYVAKKSREVYLEKHIINVLDDDDSHINFPEILVDEFNVDSDKVYHEVAKFYGFYEYDTPIDKIPQSQINWIKETLSSIAPSIKQKMIEKGILIYDMEKIYSRARYKFLALNPTSSYIPKIFFEISSGNSGYDVIVIKKKKFHTLLKFLDII